MMPENRVEKSCKNGIFVIFEVEYFEFSVENQKSGLVKLLTIELTTNPENFELFAQKPWEEFVFENWVLWDSPKIVPWRCPKNLISNKIFLNMNKENNFEWRNWKILGASDEAS